MRRRQDMRGLRIEYWKLQNAQLAQGRKMCKLIISVSVEGEIMKLGDLETKIIKDFKYEVLMNWFQCQITEFTSLAIIDSVSCFSYSALCSVPPGSDVSLSKMPRFRNASDNYPSHP